MFVLKSPSVTPSEQDAANIQLNPVKYPAFGKHGFKTWVWWKKCINAELWREQSANLALAERKIYRMTSGLCVKGVLKVVSEA